MKMSNSPLVTYTRISPNRTVMSNKKNTHIVIHHMSGNLSVETCGAVFAPTSRKASSNYGVDTKGDVGLYCPESDRAWTTGSREIDSKAVTIEVANDQIGGNWHVSDTALNKTIELCVDICKRNGIKELKFTGDKSGNLHAHRWYQSTDCPGAYLYSKFPYIASEVTKRLRGSIEPDLIVDGYDYSKVYDYNYYINKYTDIKNTFGDDKVATFNHFITNGMREARQAISNFNVGIYKDNYKDLQKAFGSDLPKYYQHYIKYGINEKRIADYHIVPVTVKDGVDYSPVYDGVYYVNKYADLKKAFGNNYDKLLNHFIQYGMKEKRQAISSFNVEIYKNNYQDLQIAYGNDYPQYYIHYIKWGKKEGRVADHAIRQVEVKYHTFQDGDTVSKIATQYKTTVDDILKLNDIKWTTGQKIRVQ